MCGISRYGISKSPVYRNSIFYFFQVTFAAQGPFATWDYINRISASIPTQRKVKDHVEAQFNHFRRGKSHTIPEKEEDIQCLQASYSASKLHQYTPGRRVESIDKVKDVVEQGSDPIRLKKVIERWLATRLTECSSDQDWSEDSDSDINE